MKHAPPLRFLSLALVLPLLSGALLSCSDKPAENEETPTVQPEQEILSPTAEPETEPNLYEDALNALTVRKYDGRAFNILTRTNVMFELVSEELTGEVTNDAVFNRNKLVEESFDIAISAFEGGNWDGVSDKLRASVTAGDFLYNLIAQVDFKTYAIVGYGSCGNWLDIPVLELDKPWWTTAANNEATINGRLFTMTGDFCVTNILYGNVIFYNAPLCENYGIMPASLQDMVFEKKWTFDRFASLTADVYEDSNGNSSKDADDLYGVILSPCAHCDEWLTAFHQPLTEASEAGVIEVVMFTDKTVSALEKVLALYYENTGTYNPGAWTEESVVFPMFASNHALFTTGILNNARTSFAGMENDFGVLPFPMWDEEQNAYYTVASDQFTVLAYPINTPETDYEYLGTITEALSLVSKRDVVPAFYDSALKNRYSMDANTAKIIDIIMDGRLFEFSFQYGNDIEIPYIFRNQIINRSPDIMSAWKSKQKIVTKTLARIAKYYGLEG